MHVRTSGPGCDGAVVVPLVSPRVRAAVPLAALGSTRAPAVRA
jgi:hypothetical protein